MDFPRWLLIPMVLVAGVAGGIMAKRISSSTPRQVSSITPTSKVDVRVPLPSVQAHTPDALLALPARELYRHLARWLLDANETEIATLLDRYRTQGGNDFEITRLLYVHWTRLNPEGAISSATNDEELYQVWTSWACHIPEAALAADAATSGKMARTIGHTIGRFHPNWLFANFDRIPPDGQESAIQGIQIESFILANPFKTLKQTERWNNKELLYAAYAAAIRKSPFDAWQWLQQHRISNPDFAGEGHGSLESILRCMKPSDARDLMRIAETMPPGGAQRDFFSNSMEFLAKADPEAALAEARTSQSSRIKAEHLALAGKAFVYHDPERAFQIADELFAACPEVFHYPEIQMPDGTTVQPRGERLYKIHPYFKALGVRDPERLMNSFLSHDPDGEAVGTFTTLSGIWAAHAPESYANWLNSQTDPRIREPAARKLVDQLASQEQYAEALDWSLSLGTPDKSPTDSVFNQWRRLDPDSALEWLETANLPDSRKTQLREGAPK